MRRFYLALSVLFNLAVSTLCAQNLLLTTQNPDGLTVCGTDTLSVTLINSQGATVSNIGVTVTLPSGIEYVAGSVDNASENNITSLNAPVFSVFDIPGGASASFSIQVRATCGLVEAINSGQLFVNQIKAEYNGGSDQINSLAYPVETGLLVVVSVSPALLSGEFGQTLTREIRFRNTRLGRIGSLRFVDQHFPGYSAATPGAATQANQSPVWFEATFDGSFFSNFGDGDEWLELNEEGVITQEITITDCGLPPFDNPSALRLSWGCGPDECQFDSTNAKVSILTSTQNPDLEFVPVYTDPRDHCGNFPAEQQVVIINHGNLPATNVTLDIYSQVSEFSGFVANSFEYNPAGAGWLPLSPNLSSPTTLDECGQTALKRSLIVIPEVPAGATTVLRFQAITCAEECAYVLPPYYMFTLYRKACPAGSPVSDSLAWIPDSISFDIRANPVFDIGTCLVNGQSYPMEYNVRADLLTSDTGFLQIRLTLPKGIYWDDACTPQIEGKDPVLFTQTDIGNGQREVLSVFKLPFNSDSVLMNYCLRYDCVPDMLCECPGTWDPDIATVTDYVNYCEDFCGLRVKGLAGITPAPDSDPACALANCYEFVLFVEATCPDNEPCESQSEGPPGELALIQVKYDVYRTNLGFDDLDDDRVADSQNPPEILDVIRRDRYLPGDTMRFDFCGRVISGQVEGFPIQVFTEIIASEMGLNGGDPFMVSIGQSIFTHRDSTVFLSAGLRIKSASGEESDCPILPAIPIPHRRNITLSLINIQPPPEIDRLISMNHLFFLPASDCSPDGLPLEEGDSIFFQANFLFKQNFVPLSVNLPPLINFRETLWWGPYAWKYPNQIFIPGKLGQYSGYVQGRAFPQHTIRPCATSLQLSPFDYSIRIARENMFPFEVRPLARLSNILYKVPPGVFLQSATADLSLQENEPVQTDQLMPFNQNGEDIEFNYASFFNTPLDEGFRVHTDLVFDPSCTFTGPDTSDFRFSVNLLIDDPQGQVLQYRRVEPLGFFDALPILELVLADSIINMPAPSLNFDFSVRNIRPAQATNAWIYIEPINGTLDNIELLRMPQQQVIPGVSGLFQLGTIGVLGNLPLQLRARNTNCQSLLVRVVTGWDCDPVAGASTATCGRDTTILDLRLLNAVLELNPLTQPAEIPLCAPSDWFVVEIFNANDGNALQLLPSVKLPQGISVLPGSTEVSYPAGSGWAAATDPQSLPGNIFQWSLAELLPALALDGLPGFTSSPQNSFRIRFKVFAECGFVANSQPIYGVDGRQPCGIATNKLRKPEDPIGLQGVGQPYGVDISLSPVGNDLLYCGELLEIAVQMQLQGTPSASDSIYLQLPAGVSYEPGSYAPGQNAPAGPPQWNGQLLRLPLPPGLGIGSIVKFNIQLRYNETAGCTDQFVVAQTRQQTTGFCETSGQFCNVYIATGEALLQLPVQNPDLVLKAYSSTQTPAGNLQLTVDIQNPATGAVPAPGVVLQVVLDQNGNELPDPSDLILQTLSSNVPLQPGAVITLSDTLQVSPDQLCRLLLVIPAAENCACAPKVYPLENWVINQGSTALCSVAPVAIGIDSLSGSTYSWAPAGLLACNTCPHTTFNPGPSVMPGDVFAFVLRETAGSCTIEHRFEVRFGETLGSTTPDQTICQGDTILLEATAGGVYQWSGPGITNPGNQQQILIPDSSATYTVTVTLADGCTGADTVSVTVLESRTTDLGIIRTCPGVPVSVLGTVTDQAGTYSQTYAAANGCDSLVTVRVELFEVEGQSEILLCEGDTITVFDSLFTTSGAICRSFITSSGCDSLHCVTVTLTPAVQISSPDSVIIVAGDSIQLQGPPGFATYLWSPSDWLSCDNCQSPWASPPNDTTYTLTVGNVSGCTAQASYRVIVYPPCDPQRLQIPNAITPNGDGVNDVFRVVPFEGFEAVAELRIYDRWGKEVYRGAGNAFWDGTVDGQPAVSDTYIYVLRILCSGEEEKIVGDVIVIR